MTAEVPDTETRRDSREPRTRRDGLLSVASRTLDIVEDLFFAFGGILVAFLVFGITYDVVGRQFLGVSAPGVVEISEYIMVWLPFLAAPRLLREGGHVRVVFALARLSPRVRSHVDVGVMILGLVVVVVLTWYSFELVMTDYQRNIKLVNIYTSPRWLVRAMMPLGFAVLALEFARSIVRHLGGVDTSDAGVEEKAVGTPSEELFY